MLCIYNILNHPRKEWNRIELNSNNIHSNKKIRTKANSKTMPKIYKIYYVIKRIANKIIANKFNLNKNRRNAKEKNANKVGRNKHGFPEFGN